jgi:DNA-binding IclR family transcriptional regulator
MSNGNPDPQNALALFRMANGYFAAQALYVAADPGVADYLTQGALTAQEVASKTGSHPDALARLLRALVAFGILNSDADEENSPISRMSSAAPPRSSIALASPIDARLLIATFLRQCPLAGMPTFLKASSTIGTTPTR